MNAQQSEPNDQQTHNHLLQWQSPHAAWLRDYEQCPMETIYLCDAYCTEITIESDSTKTICLSFSHTNPVKIYLSCYQLHHLVCTSGNPMSIYLSTDHSAALLVEGRIAQFAAAILVSELEFEIIDHDDPLERTSEHFHFNSLDIPQAKHSTTLWKRVFLVNVNQMPSNDTLKPDDLVLCNITAKDGTPVHLISSGYLVVFAATWHPMQARQSTQSHSQTQLLRLESRVGVMLMAPPQLASLQVNCPSLTLTNCHELELISTIDQASQQLTTYYLQSVCLVKCSTNALELALTTANLTLTDCDIHELRYQRAVNLQVDHCAALSRIHCHASEIYADTRSLLASTLPEAINEYIHLGHSCCRAIPGPMDQYITAMSEPGNAAIETNTCNPVSILAMLFVHSDVCPKLCWAARSALYERIHDDSTDTLLPWFWNPTQLNMEFATAKYWLNKVFASDDKAGSAESTNHQQQITSSDDMHALHLIDFILWANAYSASCPHAIEYKASIVQGLRLHQHGFYGLRLLAHALEHFPNLLSAERWRDLVNAATSAVSWWSKPSSVRDENALLVLLHQYMRMLQQQPDAGVYTSPQYVAPIFELLIHEIYHTSLPYHALAHALQQINSTLYEQVYQEYRGDYDNLYASPEVLVFE